MATPMPFEVIEEQEPSPSKEVTSREERLEGPDRLLEGQRQKFEAEVEHAKSLIARPEKDIDERLYSEETLDRAVAFVKRHIERVWRSCGTNAPTPTIGPGPDESVDLYW